MEDIDAKINPKLALVIYGSAQETNYIESHEIYWNKKGAVFGPGKPLYLETLKGIIGNLNILNKQDTRFKGIIPSKLKYIELDEENRFNGIWTTPIGKRTITHKSGKIKKINIESDYDITYVLNAGELFVYLHYNSEFFELPLPNIYNSNNVCMGSWKPKKNIFIENSMLDWESGFWDPEFNSLHRTHPFDWKDWWKEQDLKLLSKEHSSYEQIIKKFFKTHTT